MKNDDVAEILAGRGRTQTDIDRLPKWAKELLETVDLRLAESRQELTQRSGKVTPDTKVIADLYARSDDEAIPLKADTTVRFITGVEDRGDYFDVHIVDGELKVTAGSLIQIAPGGSNTIYCIAKR